MLLGGGEGTSSNMRKSVLKYETIFRVEWGKKWHFLGTKINYERCGDFFSDFLVWTEHYGCLLFPPIICAMKNYPKGGQPPFFFGPSVTHFTPLSRGKMGHPRSFKKKRLPFDYYQMVYNQIIKNQC